MPHYMVQGGYTAETWARLVKAPEDREAVVRKILEGAGGKLEALYYTFGQDDFVGLFEASDNTTAAGLAIAITASGAFRSFRTTPLMTTQEAMAAMRRAGQVGYRPPGT